MKPYRAPNKRIIMRRGNGRFRQTTFADIGVKLCEQCLETGKMSPMIRELRVENGFVDPMSVNEWRCESCDQQPAKEE